MPWLAVGKQELYPISHVRDDLPPVELLFYLTSVTFLYSQWLITVDGLTQDFLNQLDFNMVSLGGVKLVVKVNYTLMDEVVKGVFGIVCNACTKPATVLFPPPKSFSMPFTDRRCYKHGHYLTRKCI